MKPAKKLSQSLSLSTKTLRTSLLLAYPWTKQKNLEHLRLFLFVASRRKMKKKKTIKSESEVTWPNQWAEK